LAVAVRAQQLEVLEPVVAAVAVDVVQREAERSAAPVRDPAQLAAIFLEPEPDEAAFEMPALPAAAEQLIERHRLRPRHDIPAEPRVVERLAAEPETRHARGDRVAFVVEALDLRPVVSPIEPLVGRATEVAHVVGHRGLRASRRERDLRLREAVVEQHLDRRSGTDALHTNIRSHHDRTDLRLAR